MDLAKMIMANAAVRTYDPTQSSFASYSEHKIDCTFLLFFTSAIQIDAP